MATTPTYPGVYIEEVPSGVRTLTGVATSITAFLGRALRGPVNDPTLIYSNGDFERSFGGLWLESSMSYAVRHFFQAGGGQALIVRLVDDGVLATVSLTVTAGSPIVLTSRQEGSRGNQLRATVTLPGTPTADHRYTLELELLIPGTSIAVATESFDIGDADALDEVLLDSDLASADDGYEGIVPDAVSASPFLSGSDAATASTVDLEVSADTLTFGAVSGGDGSLNVILTLDHFTADPDDDRSFNLRIQHDSFDETLTGLTLDTLSAALIAASAPSLPTVVPTEGRPAAGTYTFANNTTQDIDVPVVLTLEAASPGVWGDALRVEVDHETSDTSDAALFNLTISEVDSEGEVVAQERLRNVSVDPDAERALEQVLEEESNLVRLAGSLPSVAPAATGASEPSSAPALTGGDDGGTLGDAQYAGNELRRTGVYALEKADLFNLLCVPPPTVDGSTSLATWTLARVYCADRRAMLIVDPPATWDEASDVGDLTTVVDAHANAAMYFPRVYMPDPLRRNLLTRFVPCGVVAGNFARTDAQRGVWKAPAGLECGLTGVKKLDTVLTDGEIGTLNQIGLNCLKIQPGVGPVIWGARTRRGADKLASEWKYVPVRRMALFLEESLYRGLQWAVFEPNDEPLWSQIRLNVGAFMHTLFRQGAFQGATPKDAYYVRCDKDTTTQADINNGIVNVLVGFAPLKPAEFVILKLQQIAGQLAT